MHSVFESMSAVHECPCVSGATRSIGHNGFVELM